MFRNQLERLKSDRGDGELITLIIALPLLLTVVFTIIAGAIYFENRSTVNDVTRSSARTVAILGGTSANALSNKYGQTASDACATVGDYPMVKQAYSAKSSTAIECNLMKSLATTKGLVNVTVTKVSCDPTVTTYVGQRVSCVVNWKNKGVSTLGLNFIGLPVDSVSVGTAQSEVAMTSTNG